MILGSILILVTWIFFGLLFVVLGVGAFSFLNRNTKSNVGFSQSFWWGWASIIFFLQIWHLFFKVDEKPLLLLLGLSVMILVIQRKSFLEIVSQVIKNKTILFVGLLIGLWLANHALNLYTAWDPIIKFDMGEYHLPAVRWITGYPIIPGLSNVNYRIGYNNSIFLYDALLDQYLWSGRSFYVATGVLMFGFVIQSFVSIKKIFQEKEFREIIPDLFLGLALIPALLKINVVNTLEPDLVIFILSIILASNLAKLFSNVDVEGENLFEIYLFIVLLSVTGGTVKTNFFILGAVSIITASIFLWWKKKNTFGFQIKYYFLKPMIVGLLIFLPWISRGFILSGFAFYPSQILVISLPWRSSLSLAQGEYTWIQIFARTHDPNSTDTVLKNWDWLTTWLSSIPQEIIKGYNLLVFSVIIPLFIHSEESENRKISRCILLAILPSVLYLLFWFFMAPDIRFADGAIWTVFLMAFLWLVYHADRLSTTIQSRFLIRLMAISAIFLIVLPISTPLFIVPNTANRSGLTHITTPGYIQEKTNSGLIMNVPTEFGRCWDIPQPCFSMLDPNLKQFYFWGNRFGFTTTSEY